jgi:hypothetical protein
MEATERLAYRLDVSWREWYYVNADGGELPEGTKVGNAVAMREDRVLDSDVRAAVEAVHRETGGALTDDEAEFYARTVLAAVLATDENDHRPVSSDG